MVYYSMTLKHIVTGHLKVRILDQRNIADVSITRQFEHQSDSPVCTEQPIPMNKHNSWGTVAAVFAYVCNNRIYREPAGRNCQSPKPSSVSEDKASMLEWHNRSQDDSAYLYIVYLFVNKMIQCPLSQIISPKPMSSHHVTSGVWVLGSENGQVGTSAQWNGG
jgi:hypothetical protein